jgi:cytochrome c6
VVGSKAVLLALSSGQKAGLVAVGAAFVLFALFASMVVPRFRPDFPGRHLGLFIAVAALFTAGMLATVVAVAKESEGKEVAHGETAPATTPPVGETAPPPARAPAGDAKAGRRVFLSAGCGSCHTLADAGTKGTIGPNLDQAKPALALVVDRVTNGKGVMPPFKGSLSEEQIRDVAAYVFQATRSSS